MPIIRSNAIRIKRFRELKADLRTKRDRLLVGIDIAKAQHVTQVRLAHTRILDKALVVPNTQAGFTEFWERLQAHRAATAVTEIVCAVEPTGTYHEALALFLESHGADVVLVSNTVAAFNRRTLDGTWGKSDPKDAHNLCDLLERGHVLFYSLPDGPVAALRRLVRLLRQARVDLAACKARFRNTLLPLLGPAGEPLPPALLARLPAPLHRLCPAPAEAGHRRCPQSPAPGTAEGPGASRVPPALAFECTDLTARLTAVQQRIAAIEAELVKVAQPLPAYLLLRTIPGVGPTIAAILLAEIGDIAWYLRVSQLRKLAGLDIIWVATGQWTGTARISKCGRPLLRWALYQAALGAARTPVWRTRRDAMIAKRHGDRFAFLKANIELAAKLLRIVWGVWRSGRAYELGRVERRPAPGEEARPERRIPPRWDGSARGPASLAAQHGDKREGGTQVRPSGRSQRKGVLTHNGSSANGFVSPAGRV